ncbi:MAG: phosphomannomutase/phosphoglucomutase [Gammaproteobacteria bacterium]|nr:phosphomannomutase/phosphoglucomutase [Gammaproteobacteria bacterium]
MAGEGEAALAGIPGSRWVLAIRPLARGSAGSGFAIPPAVLAGAAALVVLAVGAVLWRRRSTAGGGATLEIEYQGAIRSILDGAHPGLENLLPGAQGANRFIVDEPSFDITGGSELQAQEYGDAGVDLDLTATFVQPAAGPVSQPEEGIEVSEAEPQDLDALVPESIFRSYDIRGIVGSTLTDAGVFELGQALGSIGGDRGQQAFVVGRDGRHSSASLQDSLIAGLRASGRDVLDIGLTPTPVLYFATHHLDAHSGVMVTGSHNPPEYNGLKIVIDGETLSGDAIKAIRERVLAQDYSTGHGKLQDVEIVPEYIRRISEDIPVTLGNPLTVVVDCGNGVPGIVAPHILRAIGHDVIELFCEVDGNFPNHHPDPSQPENLASLIEAVRAEGADLGLAFDGDGDRLSVVDAEGNIVWPDQLMILFARDVLGRSPGAKVLYDVKCSGRLPQAITAAGGEAIMSRTGHSLIKAKLKETGALLAGEMSGHLFFNDRWYGFDDALYAAARLLEILVNADRAPTEVFAELPHGISTPEIRIPLPETEHQAVMDQLIAAAGFTDATISTIDGLRVDFADSWGLVRPSNTTPCLTARFEGDTSQALAGVQAKFRELLKTAAPGVKIPF